MNFEEATSKARTKRDWFDGMMRVGWALPTYKSTIVTWDFLK